MATFTWYNGEVPTGIRVKQVYGIIFDTKGRVLMKVSNSDGAKSYSFAGGKPEQTDQDRQATLRREFLEEINTTIGDDIYLVGYQLVDEENGTPPYAQVRMTGIVKEIGPVHPDTDNGETYIRMFASPDRAIELLNWGEVGAKQVHEALRIAKEHLGIKESSTEEECV